MAKLLAAPTKNAVQKTLAAQLLNTATTGDPITFDDVDGIPNLPGVLVINRVNTSGTATPSSREYIEYSGTSGTTVLITTRNVDGSNAAVTHAVGSIVEFIPDVTWADRIYDALATLVDATDTAVINPSIATTTGLTTLYNKMLSGATLSSPTLNLGSDATGDLFFRGSSKAIARLPLGTTGQVLTANASLPYWAAAAGGGVAKQDTDYSGTSSTTSSTYANITGADASVTITDTSHILLIAVVQAYAPIGAISGSVDYTIRFHDGSGAIGQEIGNSAHPGNTRINLMMTHIVPSAAAGTYTYTIQHKSNNNTLSCTAEVINFVALAVPA